MMIYTHNLSIQCAVIGFKNYMSGKKNEKKDLTHGNNMHFPLPLCLLTCSSWGETTRVGL